MKALASISDMRRTAVVVDLESRDVTALPVRPEFFQPAIEGRAPCRPFGISWSRSEVFIANHRQLLVFDRSLDFRRIEAIRLPGNTHQLLCCSDRLWVVSPWTNSLIGLDSGGDAIEVDILEQTTRPYRWRLGQEHEDLCHFNSVLRVEGTLYVAAHAFGAKSFIVGLDAHDFELTDLIRDAGSSPHGLALVEDDLYWLSTDTQEIRSRAGDRLALSRPGYARGFAATARHFVVAISQRLARGERCIGDSWIQVIDRQSRELVEEIPIADTGSINDLRLLDEYDHAHGVQPLWECRPSSP